MSELASERPTQSAAPKTVRKGRTKAPTVAEQHAEWLALLAPTGPFLSLPVLAAVLPNGVEALAAPLRERVRQAWTEFDSDPDTFAMPWQDFVLGELLRFPPSVLRDAATTDTLPVNYTGNVRPDQVAFGPDPDGTRATRLHVYRRPAAIALGALTELAEDAGRVCRDTRVPLALVTNGRYWVLAHAVAGGPTSVATFDADLWQEEPLLLRAFASLLGVTRVLPAPRRADGTASDSLAALFARTADAQAEITDTLGAQVRQAVELFVAELARLDRESGGELLAGVSDRDLYRGSLTTLLRLVFLLYAEQRELLPIDDPVYADGYAVTTLHRQLTEARDRYGDEVGDRRRAAWFRLLAVFSAVYAGCEHPDLRIPAYGGSLFDPARYPFLARAEVTDRVVHEILDALLLLRHKGKAAERLSYTGLDVEQIGHVYEGLLEFSCVRVHEPYVGLMGKLEPELPLAECEKHAGSPEWIVTATGLTAKQVDKALAAAPTAKQLADLHAACDNDSALADRVRPFFGLLRTDLRGLPTVFPDKSVLFTQVGDRRATGTHYTPRSMAEEVVEHTLAPLCYLRDEPGGGHRPRTADELLRLRVCDPTMGSGAFLVSACRYLAERVVEAWQRDGLPDDVTGTAEDIRLAALRRVASRCIYGVDRDDMAVELAKLSLWLVTLSRGKPFGFLDHALRCGDSLIGVRTERQIEMFHLDPQGASLDNVNQLMGVMDEHVRPVLAEITELRERIESHPADDIADINAKTALLDKAGELTRRVRLFADGVVAAALSTAGQGGDRYQKQLNTIVDAARDYVGGSNESAVERHLRESVESWLRGQRPVPIRPFHWPLEFPEVMRDSGFDAVVGNPPFIGGTFISSRVGKDVLSYLKTAIAGGRSTGGRADLCSYFLLRDLDIAWLGRVGIIVTNTIAQGDTREVGLDQATERGWTIYRATKSQRWPGTASLEVSLLWVGHQIENESIVLDNLPVAGITSSLDPISRVAGKPHRLTASAGISFKGCEPLGMGFVVDSQRIMNLIELDSRNRDVIFRFLNGEDVNSRPDCSASRWVIDFNDWSLQRAQSYPDVFAIIDEHVRPERQRTKSDGSYVLRKPLPQRWWQYADKRPALRKAIAELERVLVIALISRTVMPVWVPTGQVFSHKLGVFATDRDAFLALLCSTVHSAWAWKNSSTMKADLNYSPSDVFETFAQPELTEEMDRVGEELHEVRRGIMLGRQLGLTKLYNLVHDESYVDDEIARLRDIHRRVDESVARAYGWDDLELGHGFYETRQGRRFTIEPTVQTEILDRLLELNFERHEEEVRAGKVGTVGKGKRKASQDAPLSVDGGLFKPEGALF